MLAGDVEGGVGPADAAEGGGEVDDAAAFLRGHDAELVLHAEEDAEDVGVEDGGVGLGGLVGDGAGFAFGAGVVDGDVEAAEALDGAVDEAADVVLAADVGGDEFGVGAEGADFVGERAALFLAAAGDDDLRAGTGEGERGGAADASECAGDEDDLGIFRWSAHGIALCGRLSYKRPVVFN